MLEFFRLLLVVFLVLHGIGHIIWFLAAWTPISAGVKDGPWILPGDVTIRSPIGKLLGLLALAVILIFVFSALLLLLNERAWAGWAEMAVFLSFAAVVPWLRQSPGSMPINVIAANLALMFLFALELSVDLTA